MPVDYDNVRFVETRPSLGAALQDLLVAEEHLMHTLLTRTKQEKGLQPLIRLAYRERDAARTHAKAALRAHGYNI